MKRIIAILEKQRGCAERRVRTIERARDDGRGDARAVKLRWQHQLKEIGVLTLAIDALRQVKVTNVLG